LKISISIEISNLTLHRNCAIPCDCYAQAEMKATIRSIINTINAEKSTGPVTPAGKQRSSMNAITHGLTGNRMILQTHELAAYTRLGEALNHDLAPATEQERQLVQKLIDCHTRLNRIAALDGNILNFSLTQNESDAAHDDELETIAAQCRAWVHNADSFEKLGRYEARISRQMLQYTAELERLQKARHDQFEKEWAAREAAEKESRTEADNAENPPAQINEDKPFEVEIGSFRKTPRDTSTNPKPDARHPRAA
jgi:hypothetical protein